MVINNKQKTYSISCLKSVHRRSRCEIGYLHTKAFQRDEGSNVGGKVWRVNCVV